MEATPAWLPANSDDSKMKVYEISKISVSRPALIAIKNWTATKSIFQLRKELELIREETPDLYEALAKDDPDLIK